MKATTDDRPQAADGREVVTVLFDFWGQRCMTEFDGTSELTPMQWLTTIYNKFGLANPEIVFANGVSVDVPIKDISE